MTTHWTPEDGARRNRTGGDLEAEAARVAADDDAAAVISVIAALATAGSAAALADMTSLRPRSVWGSRGVPSRHGQLPAPARHSWWASGLPS